MDALGNYLGMALYRGQQNPALSYFEGMRAASIPVEMQLRGAEAQKAIGELEQERQLRTAMQGIDLSTPEGMNQAIAAAGKISPVMAMKFSTVRDAMQADARKALSETINNASKFMKDNLPGLQFNQYPMFKQTMTAMSPLVGFQMPPLEAFSGPGGEAKFAEWKNKTLYGSTMLQQSIKPPEVQKIHVGEQEVTRQWNPQKGQFETIATAPREAGGQWSFQTVTDNAGNTQIIPINKKSLEVGPPIATKAQALDPAATDFLARMMLSDPKSLPAMGFGPQMRQPVFARAAKIALEEGINPQDVAIKSAILGTIKTGLGQLEAQTQKIEGFVKTFDKNLSALRQQSKMVGRTGSPIINRYILWTKGQIAGDPEVSKFNVLIKSVANEAARITSSATGGGVTAESEMSKWESMIAGAQNDKQLNAALDAMELESHNRLQSNREQITLGKSRYKDIAAAKTIEPGPPEGGGGARAVTAEERQAFQNKVNQVNAMPAGPNKDRLMRQLDDFKRKWGL